MTYYVFVWQAIQGSPAPGVAAKVLGPNVLKAWRQTALSHVLGEQRHHGLLESSAMLVSPTFGSLLFDCMCPLVCLRKRLVRSVLHLVEKPSVIDDSRALNKVTELICSFRDISSILRESGEDIRV